MKTWYLEVALIFLIVSLGFTSYFSAKDSYSATGMVVDDLIEISKETYKEEIPEEEIKKIDDVPKNPRAAIEIKDLKFIPNKLNITKGTTVIWFNNDLIMVNERIHMVVAHNNMFRSQRLYYKQTFNFTFDEPGTYTYVDPVYRTSTGGLVMKTAEINVV